MTRGARARARFVPRLMPRLMLGLMVGALVLGVQGASAQSGPKSLVPGGFSSAPQSAPGIEREAMTDPSKAGTGISGIAIEALDAVDPDSIGVLDQKTGGFAADIWTGSDRAVIEALFQKLPPVPRSAAQADITRRLLLTRAAFPAGSPANRLSTRAQQAATDLGSTQAEDEVIALPAVGADGLENRAEAEATPDVRAAPTSLLAARLNRLWAMGRFPDVIDLWNEGSARRDDPAAQRIVAEALVFQNQPDSLNEACQFGEGAESLDGADRFWLRLEVYCLATGGNLTAAQFNATLLRDEGDPRDRQFLTVIEPLLGGRALSREAIVTLYESDRLDGLESAILSQTVKDKNAGAAWAGKMHGAVNPATRLRALQAPGVSDEDRLDQLEALVDLGALESDRLANAYRDVSFPPTVFEQVITTSEELPAPLARALLFQALEREVNPAARAELAASILSVAALSDRRPALRRVLQDTVMAIAPDRTLWWFASDAIEVLATPSARFLTRNKGAPNKAATDKAIAVTVARDQSIAAWARILRDEAARNPKAAVEAILVWPVLKVMGETMLDRSWPDPLAAWSRTERVLRATDPIEEITRLQLLLQAFGEPVPIEAWTGILAKAPVSTGRIPNAILLASLLQAASERRQGDVLLLSMIILGEPGPTGASAGVLADVVRSLVKVGLPSEARALALDALLSG